MKLLTFFFLMGAVLPLPSILLYVLVPSGTVEFFNGQPTPTSAFWCSLTASGDATVSFLCFCALLTKSTEVHVLVVRSMAVYSIFHFGAFWFWHHHGDSHPPAVASGYPVSIVISLAAAAWWGWLRPPREDDSFQKAKQ